jgi:hypothetical protein
MRSGDVGEADKRQILLSAGNQAAEQAQIIPSVSDCQHLIVSHDL